MQHKISRFLYFNFLLKICPAVESPQALPIDMELRSKTESLKNKHTINEKEIIEVIIKETDWKKLKTQKIYGLSDHNHYDSLKKFNSEINGEGKSFDIDKIKLEMGFDEQFLEKYKKKMSQQNISNVLEIEKGGKEGGIDSILNKEMKAKRSSMLEVKGVYADIKKENENSTVKVNKNICWVFFSLFFVFVKTFGI
jgi:hypothetical protein